MKNSLKKGLHLYASRQFFFLQSSLFCLVWPAVLVLLTAQVQMSLQEECPRALGMEDGRIPDTSIKASSALNDHYQAANGRLNFKATFDRTGAASKGGGWLAKGDDRNPWFEVRFGSAATVSRVATQGVYPYETWVKTFQLEYSKDGMTFFLYNNQQTFEGNRDPNSTKSNELKPAIDVRVIRIHPKTWRSGNRLPGMRVEFYGCRPVPQGNVTGQAISAESIEVKWQFVGNKKDNSLPCGFKVWYRSVHTSATNDNTWIKSQTVDTETTHYIIHNLLAYTTYEIYVEALNGACSGRLDHVARVTTQEKECPRALGMEEGRIPDSSIKASSALNMRYQAANGRLNFKATNDRYGGWLAKIDDRNPWFEVSFGSAATVSRIATQGVYPYATWVKTFMLEYSKDGNTFVFYNNNQTFQGNRDQNSIKNNELKPAIDARVIRIHLKSWQWKRYPGMRVEFYGCRPVSHGNVTGQAISAESIEVKWQFVGNKEENSLPCGFKVWYRAVHTSTTNTNTWINQTVDTKTTHYIIHNLLAYTTYEIYVEALNDACSGPLDHVARVTTHEKVAPSAPPRNITVVSVNYNSVVLQWLPPPQQSRNGKVLQYLVRSWPADEFINNSIARNYSHNNTSIEQQGRFEGLKSDTNYTVVLTVSNSVGTSPSSSPLYFRTLKVVAVPSTTSSPITEKMLPTMKVSPSTTVKRGKREENGRTSYVITGVVLAVAAGLVLVIAIIAVYIKRRKNKEKKSPKKEQGVIAYNNDATFSHSPNLVDRVDNRITHQEQNELQTIHPYYISKGNVKQNSFSKSNSHYASDIYSYANPEDLRCNQSKNEKFVEQNPMCDTAKNLKSSNETADYDTVQGNPSYSLVSDKSFFEKQKNAPSSKNLVDKEVMGNLCSTQKAPEVSTAQPQMEPKYHVLEGPDPTATLPSAIHSSDTGSESHKHTQNQGPCDYDVIWNSPNQSQSDIKNIKESSVPLADKMASNPPNLYYEKVYLSKADEDVVYDSTYDTVGDILA